MDSRLNGRGMNVSAFIMNFPHRVGYNGRAIIYPGGKIEPVTLFPKTEDKASLIISDIDHTNITYYLNMADSFTLFAAANDIVFIDHEKVYTPLSITMMQVNTIEELINAEFLYEDTKKAMLSAITNSLQTKIAKENLLVSAIIYVDKLPEKPGNKGDTYILKKTERIEKEGSENDEEEVERLYIHLRFRS